MSFFQPRDQIEYVTFDKTEYGFVTSIGSDGTVLCRFWRDPRGDGTYILRTRANSEGCHSSDLRKYDSGAAFEVRAICDAMGWA